MKHSLAVSALGLMMTLLAGSAPEAQAQVATATPWPLQQSSELVLITYHADRGNQALMGYTGKVYAHTGVITDKSSSSSDWKHAPKWGDNDEKYELKRIDDDTYTLFIDDIATYYGLEEGEQVTSLAFVFRSEDSKLEGKGDANSDILVKVSPEGFAACFTWEPAVTILTAPQKVTFTVATTESAYVSISIDDYIHEVENAKGLSIGRTFDQPGTYTVTGTAKKDDQVFSESMQLTYIGPSEAKDYPGGLDPKANMGARRNDDGSVTFCLAAPGKESVVLVGSWDDYQVKAERQMYYTDRGGYRYFWTTVSGLDDDKDYPYYYLVDCATKVADPYAKLVLDCYNDKFLTLDPSMPQYPYDRFSDTMLAVYRGNRDSYDWKHRDSFSIPDHGSLVIYELLLRDFTGTDTRADGTLAEAMEKIPYLKELGVNAVELMPIMEFNGNNSWGYNPNFYMAPDKAYGTPDDYRRFVDECHANGIAVILDIALNHSDGLHPWYQMYPSASNPFYNAEAPHDWSVLNDWRQEHPLVEQQWKDALQYWLDSYDVDGYRFDLIKGLGDSDSYTSTDAYNSSRVARMKRLHAWMKEIKPDAIHINEGFLGKKEEGETGADGQLNWANVSDASCQTAMGYMSNAALSRYYAPYDNGHAWGTTVSYAESHDEERMGYKVFKYAPASVKDDHACAMRRLGLIASELLFTPGPHMIWQFQEMGADQTTKSSNGSNNTNPKKVVWNYLNDRDRYELMVTYRVFGNFRRNNPDLYVEDGVEFKPSYSGWANGRSATLTRGDKEAVLLVNPNTDKEISVSVAATNLSAANHQVVYSTYGFEPDPQFDGNTVTVTLPQGTFVMLATTNVASLDGAVADTLPAAPARVRGEKGRIVVDGTYETIAVSNLAGMRMPSLEVPAGLYVVTVDGRTAKVIVR